MLTFLDLQAEVKRRSIRDQSGTQYETAIKNAINSSLFRISREAPWRQMRRKAYFSTKTSYTTGSGAATVTSANTTVTVTGATFLTSGIEIGRRIKIGTSSTIFIIRQVTGETTVVLDKIFDAVSSTANSYEIYPQMEYNLPIQCGHRMFLWHENYGYPYKMEFMPDQDFFESGRDLTEKNVPTHYRMWGEDMVLKQITTPTTLSVFSTSSADTNKGITIFGKVGGYPDFEVVTTSASSGTTPVTSTKTFQEFERVAKNDSTTGRISIAASALTTNVFSVLLTGDSTAGILYKKIQIYPLPTEAFEINAYYYKDPYRLVSDGDIHELGQEFDESIILLSVSKIKAENSQTEAATFYTMWQDEMRSLRKTNMEKMDWFTTLKKPYESNGDMVVKNLQYRQAGSFYGPATRY